MACTKFHYTCCGRASSVFGGRSRLPKTPPPELEDDGRICHCPAWLSRRFALLRLLNQRVRTRTVHPRTYLSACHEVIGITLVVTWLMAFISVPHELEHQPARHLFDVHSPMFGRVFPPASWVGLCFCSVNVLLAWRYMELEQTRATLLSPSGLKRVRIFSRVTAVALALASNLWLLLWLIEPSRGSLGGWTGVVHTCIFLSCALAKYLCALAFYLQALYDEKNFNVQRSNTVFIVVYGFSVTLLAATYLYGMFADRFGEGLALPSWMTQSVDVLWIACVCSITSFCAKGPALHVTQEIALNIPAESQGEVRTRMCTCPKWLERVLPFVSVLNAPAGTHTFYPRMYLSASNQVFGCTLIVTWLMTYTFFPAQIEDHPAKRIIGSYNPCFGWDFAPASWVALLLCSMNVLFTWRYVWLEETCATLLSPNGLTGVQTFGKVTAVALALASNLWLLLWLIGPIEQSPGAPSTDLIQWLLHTCIFVAYALSNYLCALAFYVEALHDEEHFKVQRSNTVFIVVYGLSVSFLVIVYFYDLLQFRAGHDPALPPWMTQSADIVWIACVSSMPPLLPKEPGLTVTTDIVLDPEAAGLVVE